MTAVYDQTPGKLDIIFRKGDSIAPQVTFGFNMTGFTVTAGILAPSTGTQVVAFTVAVTDAAAGIVNLSLTANQTNSLSVGRYAWYLKWVAGSDTRTALAGTVEVLA